MEVRLAENYGFCFGVKRATKLAEANKNSSTLGPLIHNPKEIERLEKGYNVKSQEDITKLSKAENVIIRTHGIEKDKKEYLENENFAVIDATCPFVTKPQEIAEKMSDEGYDVVIFGDNSHPEVKGVKSYAKKAFVVSGVEDLKKLKLSERVAVISQTTRKIENYLLVTDYLVKNCREIRVFNTICNATFDNQDAVSKLAKEVDIMIIVGGKNSSNTKQLLSIASKECDFSYLVEDEKDLKSEWFKGKNVCGVSAGASTPDWIIDNVVDNIRKI